MASVDAIAQQGGTFSEESLCLPQLVASGRVLPWRGESPVEVYRHLATGRWSVLLESAQDDVDWGRFTLVGANPLLTVDLWADRCVVSSREGRRMVISTLPPGRLTPVLRRILRCCASVRSEVPLAGGGLVGYVGFGAAPLVDPVPVCPRPSPMPLASLFVPGDILVFDAVLRKLHVIALCEAGAASCGGGEVLLDRLVDKVRASSIRETAVDMASAASSMDRPESTQAALRTVFPRAEVEAAVATAREAVRAGEAIQVVVAQPFVSNVTADSLDTYLALRALNPSPYMYHLRVGDYTLVGSSPETLVRVRNGCAVMRPIAGTRKRGATAAEDQMLARELLADPKERAEHLMLLDLARNDLGKVARQGTVSVDASFQLESYSHVMHLVSSVSAQLDSDVDALEVFRATFPAGTVSGAPKVRAMQLLSDLERWGRGAYAGAVGYFGSGGDADTCICIRTLVFGPGGSSHQQRIVAFGGAGVVADSDPAREYEEMLHKVSALSSALRLASAAPTERVLQASLLEEAQCF